MDPITEPEIRERLKGRLLGSGRAAGRLIEEFPVEGGRARIDVTVLGGATFDGYEIKSDLDSFVRFSNQIHAYNRVFDTIHIVCGPTHCVEALRIVPSWWGVIVAHRANDGAVELNDVRPASHNPRQEAFSLASLLWRDEAAEILASHDHSAPKKASSHTLWETIAKALPTDRIRDLVVETIVQRGDYRASAVSTM